MTAKAAPRRLTEFASSMLPTDRHNLAEIENEEVTITAARIGSTKMGAFAAMETILPTGEIMTFVTTGFLVIDAIAKVIESDAFPVAAKFTRPDRAWRIE